MIQTSLVSYEEGTSSCSAYRSFWRKMFPTGFASELKEMVSLAWPAILTTLLQFLLQTFSIINCGHLHKAQLDAAGLANSMINVFGVSIGVGMSTACDTFFSQTFGSSNKKRVGVYLQRSLIIMNSTALLVCCFHMNIMPFLIAVGQHPEIAKLTANYLLYFLPGVFFDYNFLVLARYLQNQGIVYPSLFCALFGNVVNIVSQYVCIYVLHFDYIASAICQASSLFIMMISQFIYIVVSKVYNPTWDGFNTKGALQGWGMFFKLAIPGIFMIGIEEWSFEFGAFVAGSISVVQLGIQTVLFQLEAISYMIPLGVAIAVNIRVGQHLGANRPEHAKTSYRVGLVLMIIIATVLGVIVMSMRNYIPLIFTHNKDIIEGVSDVLILNALFQLSDGISATSTGALRGCGRQVTGAVIPFIGHWIISLPIGTTLALLTHMKVYGFWVGLLIGVSIETIIFIIVVNKTNWQYQCEKAASVAYGDDVGAATYEKSFSYQPIPDESTETETGISDGETDPLIRRSRRQLVRSLTNSHRAVLNSSNIQVRESTEITPEAYRKILIKRGVYMVIFVIIAAAAVAMRVFQPTPCYPVTNSSMTTYLGVLPLCNETEFHHPVGSVHL